MSLVFIICFMACRPARMMPPDFAQPIGSPKAPLRDSNTIKAHGYELIPPTEF